MKASASTKRRRSHENTKENELPVAVGRNDAGDTKRVRCDEATSDSVDTLLSGLDAPDWKVSLQNHFESSSFKQLAQFIASERAGAHVIYPPPHHTWAALTACPLDAVKVVIVGQDPYHGPHQAHGLCFSVLSGQAIPPSLKNKYKELGDDPNVVFQSPNHGHLVHWARQGVLMLNTVLTVRQGQAHSHKKRGWEDVTDEIIRAVVRRDQGCVFLLWGQPATQKALSVLLPQSHQRGPRKKGTVSSDIAQAALPNHTIICTSHPSPLGARKTDSPFLGSRCFSRCNEALAKLGQAPIDWSVPADATIP